MKALEQIIKKKIKLSNHSCAYQHWLKWKQHARYRLIAHEKVMEECVNICPVLSGKCPLMDDLIHGQIPVHFPETAGHPCLHLAGAPWDDGCIQIMMLVLCNYLVFKHICMEIPMMSMCQMLKTESCHDANFFVTGGVTGWRYDSLWCCQWWQNWHHNNTRFSKRNTSDCFELCYLVQKGDMESLITRETWKKACIPLQSALCLLMA